MASYHYPPPTEEIIHLLPCTICSAPFDPCTLPSHFYDPYNAFSFPHQPLDSMICPSCFAEELARRAPKPLHPMGLLPMGGHSRTGSTVTEGQRSRAVTVAESRPGSRNVLAETPGGSRPGSARGLSRQTSRSRELVREDKSISSEMLRDVSERADSAAAFVHGGQPPSRTASTRSRHVRNVKSQTLSHSRAGSQDPLRPRSQSQSSNHSHIVQNLDRFVSQGQQLGQNRAQSHDLLRQRSQSQASNHSRVQSLDQLRQRAINHSRVQSLDVVRQKSVNQNASNRRTPSNDQLRAKSLSHNRAQSHDLLRKKSLNSNSMHGRARSHDLLRQISTPRQTSSFDQLRSQQTPFQQSHQQDYQQHKSMEHLRHFQTLTPEGQDLTPGLAISPAGHQRISSTQSSLLFQQHASQQQQPPSPRKLIRKSSLRQPQHRQEQIPQLESILKNSLRHNPHQQAPPQYLYTPQQQQDYYASQQQQHQSTANSWRSRRAVRKELKAQRAEAKSHHRAHRANLAAARLNRENLARGISLPLFCPTCRSVVLTEPRYRNGACCVSWGVCLLVCCGPLSVCTLLPWAGRRGVCDVDGCCPGCGGVLSKWDRRKNELRVFTWVGVGDTVGERPRKVDL